MFGRYTVPLILLIVAIFVGGHFVRNGIDFELSVDSIQAWVTALTWKGPLLYMGLVTFRQFLFLPSALLLPVGGLCFGVVMGTALGSAGIFISGTLKFCIARGLRQSEKNGRAGARMQLWIQRLEKAGPLIVGLVTAHPVGPMTVMHWAAGFSTIRFGGFLLALALGGVVRAATYAIVGSTLQDANPVYFYAACAALLTLILVPLAHPGIRRRILG